MKNLVLKNINDNNREKMKYYRGLESAQIIALNISAIANSGGGYIVFGVKDNYTSLEIKGIGIDYRIKEVLDEVNQMIPDKNVWKVNQLRNDDKKVILAIRVEGLRKKLSYKGRRYIMGKNMEPRIIDEKVFISHSSSDNKYGDALVKLLRGIGFKRSQIIFTSNDDYGIPIGMNIFDYLKDQISDGAFMIYLLSNNYFESVACLNEMGAAWIIQNDYVAVGTPNFDFSNPNFASGAIDPRKIGFKLNNRKRMVEFKNQVLQRFDLKIDEIDWNSLLDEYIEAINNI